MDQTEITNNEYRQFVYWVRDSIARRILGAEFPEEFLVETYDDELEVKDEADWQLNWNSRFEYISFNPSKGQNSEYAPLLAQMFLNESERFYQRKSLTQENSCFQYYWIDLQEAAKKGRPLIKRISNTDADEDEEHRVKMKNPNMPFPAEPGQIRGKDLNLGVRNSKGQNNAIGVMKIDLDLSLRKLLMFVDDTLCWIHDFTYANNDHMSNMYFWHPAYDEYPVVGVTWQQANAFNVWRTQLMNSWRKAHYQSFVQDFRLPGETEWEYASRAGLDLNPYPWGGPYIRNSRGCFLGNFKPLREDTWKTVVFTLLKQIRTILTILDCTVCLVMLQNGAEQLTMNQCTNMDTI